MFPKYTHPGVCHATIGILRGVREMNYPGRHKTGKGELNKQFLRRSGNKGRNTLCGRTLDEPWTNPGRTLDEPWTNLGRTLDEPWTNLGRTLDEPWTNKPV